MTSAKWYERFNTKIDVGTAIGVMDRPTYVQHVNCNAPLYRK